MALKMRPTGLGARIDKDRVRGTDGRRPGCKKYIDLLRDDLNCECWQSSRISLCDPRY